MKREREREGEGERKVSSPHPTQKRSYSSNIVSHNNGSKDSRNFCTKARKLDTVRDAA